MVASPRLVLRVLEDEAPPGYCISKKRCVQKFEIPIRGKYTTQGPYGLGYLSDLCYTISFSKGWFLKPTWWSPLKLSSSPLKRDHPKRKAFFQPSFFRGYVNFWGSNIISWEMDEKLEAFWRRWDLHPIVKQQVIPESIPEFPPRTLECQCWLDLPHSPTGWPWSSSFSPLLVGPTYRQLAQLSYQQKVWGSSLSIPPWKIPCFLGHINVVFVKPSAGCGLHLWCHLPIWADHIGTSTSKHDMNQAWIQKIKASHQQKCRSFFTFSPLKTYFTGGRVVIEIIEHLYKTARMTCVPWSKVAILGMVIPPLIGILIMGK